MQFDGRMLSFRDISQPTAQSSKSFSEIATDYRARSGGSEKSSVEVFDVNKAGHARVKRQVIVHNVERLSRLCAFDRDAINPTIEKSSYV